MDMDVCSLRLARVNGRGEQARTTTAVRVRMRVTTRTGAPQLRRERQEGRGWPERRREGRGKERRKEKKSWCVPACDVFSCACCRDLPECPVGLLKLDEPPAVVTPSA